MPRANRSKSYLIAFELNDDSMDYGRFFMVLDSLAYSIPVVSSVWLVKTNIAEELLAGALLRRMGPRDKLVMTECLPDAVWRVGLLGPKEQVHRVQAKRPIHHRTGGLLN